MRVLLLEEILRLHQRILNDSGGQPGIRDLNLLELAVSQPVLTSGEVYDVPLLTAQAVGLGFTLAGHRPFIDGNKRVGHAAMETFLVLNGYELHAEREAQASMIRAIAEGQMLRASFAMWVAAHIRPLNLPF